MKADWALLTQPNWLERLVNAYNSELQLQPTVRSRYHARELPMPKYPGSAP